MPQLKLSEQEVVAHSSREYQLFACSRPWKGGLKKVAKSVWPKWPLGGAATDVNENATHVDFLDKMTQFGRIEQSTKRGGDVGGDAGLLERVLIPPRSDPGAAEQPEGGDGSVGYEEGENNKDKPVGTRLKNSAENKWKACDDCGEMLRDWSQVSQRPSGKKFTCADAGRVCNSTKATCASCDQTPCACKKRQKPFSIFSDLATSRLPDGFLVEIKFRPGTIEGLGLGPPWMSIWGCCQQCRLIRTMDRRERVDEFLIEHQSHNPHWKDMQIGSFDFRIEEQIRELYKIFCDASRNGLLAYATGDKYIPTKVTHPDLNPGLQKKIHHLEKLLKSGTETRKELETMAGIYCKRKRMSQSTVEKRAKKKTDVASNEMPPNAQEHRSEEDTPLKNQWPQAENYESAQPLLSRTLGQGIHLPLPTFGEEVSQPSTTSPFGENLKSNAEQNEEYNKPDQPQNESMTVPGVEQDRASDLGKALNEQQPLLSSPHQGISTDGSDFGLNLFDLQASVGDGCLRLALEGGAQGGVHNHTSSTTAECALEPR